MLLHTQQPEIREKKLKHMKNKKYKKSIIYLALVFTILWFSNTIILNAVTINKENSVKGQPEGQPEGQAEVQAEEQAENETRDLAVENTTEKYIDFGTYPQTEITDKALIEAIESAIAEQENNENIKEASNVSNENETINRSVVTEDNIENPGNDYMGICVLVNGIKYSRIIKDDQPYYYKWEPIKWKILENNGKTLFVVADEVLDCKKYNESKQEITWEKSTLRSWLNGYGSEQNLDGIDYSTGGFLQVAFTQEEKDSIARTNLTNPANESYNTAGGNTTTDSVFLLSIADVTSEKYGFSSNPNASSGDRQAAASDYAWTMGVTKSPATGMEENCDWWLRGPGMYGYDGAYVNFYGYTNQGGLLVSYEGIGVRPALYINLSSDEGTGTEDNKNEDTEADDKSHETSGGEVSPNQEEQPVMIEKLTIKAPSKKLAAGKKIKLTLSITPKNATNKAVLWKTSNKKYATVDKNGKITLKKAGAGKSVTITAIAKDGSGKKASIKIKILKHAVKSIKLEASSETLKAGKSMKLKATIKTTGKSVNKTLKWTSSNTKYAKVSSKGKVTAKKAGKGKTVTITATSTDGSNKKAKVKIRIK